MTHCTRPPGFEPNADGSVTIYLQHQSPGLDRKQTGCPHLMVLSHWPYFFTGRSRLFLMVVGSLARLRKHDIFNRRISWNC